MTEQRTVLLTNTNEIIGRKIDQFLGNTCVTVPNNGPATSEELQAVFARAKEDALSKNGDAILGFKAISTTENATIYGGAIVSLKPAVTP